MWSHKSVRSRVYERVSTYVRPTVLDPKFNLLLRQLITLDTRHLHIALPFLFHIFNFFLVRSR